MRNIWKSRNSIERELRAQRPEPSHELVETITARVSSRPNPRSTRLRLGLAAGFTMALAVGLGAFGGLGYASAAANHVAQSAFHIVAPPPSPPAPSSGHGVQASDGQHGKGPDDDHDGGPIGQGNHGNGGSGDDDSSAHGEYGHTVVVCHNRQTISIDSNALGAHLAIGDSLGACTPDSDGPGHGNGHDH